MVPPTAQATTVAGEPPEPFQAWADEALVPTPNVSVTVVRAACPEYGLVACADAEGRVIYLARHYWTKQRFFHELFHVYWPLLPQWKRDRLAGMGEEEAAEAYSLCARRRTLRHRIWSGYGYVATPARHARICHLFKSG